MSDLQYGKEDISNIAKFQRIVCWLFLIALIGLFFPVITLIAQIIAIFYIYYLARSLKVAHPGLYAFAMFIPLVALIVLLNVIQRATKVLRTYSIRVSLMGANKADVNRFLSVT